MSLYADRSAARQTRTRLNFLEPVNTLTEFYYHLFNRPVDEG